MKRKNVLIFIAFILAILIITTVILSIKDKNGNKPYIKTQNINLQEFKLEEREMIFVNNELLVGENIKELENGYYDFKISIKDNFVLIYLNKLWYETYGNDYIQDEYLAKICREIVRVLDYSYDKESIEYELYKYIKQNYLNVKQGLIGTNVELEEIAISSINELGQCVVYIKVE